MERIKKIMIIIAMFMGLTLIVYGIGYVKYKIWRAEHPKAETWTFFIPKGK